VERQLKNGINFINPVQLAILEKELNTVLSQLYEEIIKSPAAETVTELESDSSAENKDESSSALSGAALEVLNEAEALLRMGNPACLSLIKSISQISANEALKNKLIQQIEDFEFDAALDTLIKLKKEN